MAEGSGGEGARFVGDESPFRDGEGRRTFVSAELADGHGEDVVGRGLEDARESVIATGVLEAGGPNGC